MALKQSCTTLKKVADDEPIFVLRAKDVLAPDIVLRWIRMADKLGVDKGKLNEALDCFEAMKKWQDENGAKTPD